MTTEQATTTSPQAMPETSHPPVSNADSEHGSAITQHGTGEKAGLWSTKGRIGRVRYYNRVTLPTMIVNTVFTLLLYYSVNSVQSPAETAATALTVSQFVLGIPLAIFVLIQAKRRLNDLNKSGWLMLLLFIPLINLIPFIMATFIKGTDGDNRFGAEPSPLTSTEMTLFWILIGLSVAAYVGLIVLMR